jgi:hypothetical protein
MPKKNRAEELKRDNAPLQGALIFFVGGCLAELYLLMARKYYVNGNVDQMLAWNAAMPTLIWIGWGVLLAGVLLALVWRKERGLKRIIAWSLLLAGLFFALGNLVMKYVFPTGATILIILTVAATVLGILWFLYARDCTYAMVVLGTGLFAAWVCRHGIHNLFWKSYVIAGAVVYLVLLAALVITARKVERNDGLLGSLRVLPKNCDCTILFTTCGLSAAATVLSLFSTAAAYYAMWVLGIVIFILAVYYTVREL